MDCRPCAKNFVMGVQQVGQGSCSSALFLSWSLCESYMSPVVGGKRAVGFFQHGGFFFSREGCSQRARSSTSSWPTASSSVPSVAKLLPVLEKPGSDNHSEELEFKSSLHWLLVFCWSLQWTSLVSHWPFRVHLGLPCMVYCCVCVPTSLTIQRSR